MHHLTPNFILNQYARSNYQSSFPAATLFVDIAGFTPLTLALMEHGTEGAEVLAYVLVTVFEPLIEEVYARGGFIARDPGDGEVVVIADAEKRHLRVALIVARTHRHAQHATVKLLGTLEIGYLQHDMSE